jgi:hypothetical protein
VILVQLPISLTTQKFSKNSYYILAVPGSLYRIAPITLDLTIIPSQGAI